MKVLVDTNIVLDVLLERPPFSVNACLVFASIERGAAAGLLGSTTVTTVYYLARKQLGRQATKRHIGSLLALFDVAVAGRDVCQRALELEFADFEDAVLHEAARDAGADGIVTRNTADFKKAHLPIYTPDAFLKTLVAPPS